MPDQDEVAVLDTSENTDIGTRSDPPSRDQLESNVGSALQKIFGDEDLIDGAPEKTEPVTADTVDGQDAPEAATDDEATLEKEAAEIDATVGQPASAKPAAVPTLPAAYRRSLKALEWTDDEITEAAKHPGFITAAAKLHSSRNKEVAGWAELGRKQREGPTSTPTDATPGQKTSTGGLAMVDVKALKAEFGEDKLIDAIAGPVNKAIETFNAMLPDIQKVQRESQTAKLEMLNQQIDSFFSGTEMKAFHPRFGTGAKSLTPEQEKERGPVLEMAGNLLVGAEVQGRSLTLGDALQLAFDSVSSEFKEQAVRTNLRSQLKTRERGLSLRPSARGTTPVAGKVDSRAALERKVQAGLRTVFTEA